MTRKVLAIVLSSMMIFTCGCQNTESSADSNSTLSVTTLNWGSTVEYNEAQEPETITYDNLQKGDVVYDGSYGTLTVKSASSSKVVLKSSGGLIEQNEDGTINMMEDAPKSITVNAGEEIILASQTMDSGVTITLEY